MLGGENIMKGRGPNCDNSGGTRKSVSKVIVIRPGMQLP